MSLIWHIVKKDCRHLRWLLAGWLAIFALQIGLGAWAQLAAAYVFQAIPDALHAMNWLLIDLQLIVAAMLAREIVHTDLLVESRTHWLTLPISGGQLLAAKLGGVILIVWLLPAAALWPWWLAHHWGLAELLFGTGVLVALHSAVTLPALMVAALTDSWTRFATWLFVFVFAVTMAGVALMIRHESIPVEIRPSALVPGSRMIVAIAVIALTVAVVLANQYLTRDRSRSLLMAGVGGLFVAMSLVFWNVDFLTPTVDTLTAVRLPEARIRFQLSPISGGAESPVSPDRIAVVGLDTEGSIAGFAPGDSVTGQLLNFGWKWPNNGIWRSGHAKVLTAFTSRRRIATEEEKARLFLPKEEVLYSLGLPRVPSYVARRLLAEPAEFSARAEMAIMREELLAEVPAQAGNRFGRGSERFAIATVDRNSDFANLAMVQTLPLLRLMDFQQFPTITTRSFLFSNLVHRADGAERQAVQGEQRTRQLGPFAGVLVSRFTSTVYAPREIISRKPIQSRVIDPKWTDGFTLEWIERHPIARVETDLVEPHFVTHVETPSFNPLARVRTKP